MSNLFEPITIGNLELKNRKCFNVDDAGKMHIYCSQLR